MRRIDWIGGVGGAAVGAGSAYLWAVSRFTDFGVKVGDHLLPEDSSILDALLQLSGGYSAAINNAGSFTDRPALLLSVAIGLIVGAFVGLLSVAVLGAVNRANR